MYTKTSMSPSIFLQQQRQHFKNSSPRNGRPPKLSWHLDALDAEDDLTDALLRTDSGGRCWWWCLGDDCMISRSPTSSPESGILRVVVWSAVASSIWKRLGDLEIMPAR